MIDAVFTEIAPFHATIKIWKTVPLATDTLTGFADFVIAKKEMYVMSPLLCVALAKRDDFFSGRTQCLAMMVACAWQNQQAGGDIDIYCIVSNGQGWVFYRLATDRKVWESAQYSLHELPVLLGILDYVCAACAANIV